MNLLSIRQTLTNSGAPAAERQLALIADNQGDDQLAILVQELTPNEISKFLAEGDYTKPSIVAHHITPAQLLGALQRLGSKWGNLRGVETDTLLPLKEELSDFLLSALLHGNEGTSKEMIETILEDTLAEDALVAIVLFEPGCPEFLKEKDWATSQHGTWQELYMRIRDTHPAAFQRLSKEVTSLFGKRDSDDDDVPSQKAEKFLRRTLQALVTKADELGTGATPAGTPTAKKAKALFEDY